MKDVRSLLRQIIDDPCTVGCGATEDHSDLARQIQALLDEPVGEVRRCWVDHEGEGEIEMVYASDYDSLLAKYNALLSEKASEWISVKERLPEWGEQVHIIVAMIDKHNKERFLGEAWWRKTNWEDYWPEDATITHWMPMPAPPKEEPR